MIIDFHTHNPRHDVLSIENLSLLDRPSDHYFTYGLHPWHLTQMNTSEFQARLLKIREHEKFLALGEIGLDRACAIDYRLQRQAFSYQLDLASDLNIDVVIIHCVRALNDIMELSKKSNFKGTMVFHDANFSLEDSKRLIDNGHYLSFGTNLLRESSKAANVFSQMDTNFIFLETDDTAQSIEDIYEFAASKMGIEESELTSKILKNFQTLFPTLLKK